MNHNHYRKLKRRRSRRLFAKYMKRADFALLYLEMFGLICKRTYRQQQFRALMMALNKDWLRRRKHDSTERLSKGVLAGSC